MKQLLARETNVSLHIELAPVDIGFFRFAEYIIGASTINQSYSCANSLNKIDPYF